MKIRLVNIPTHCRRRGPTSYCLVTFCKANGYEFFYFSIESDLYEYRMGESTSFTSGIATLW